MTATKKVAKRKPNRKPDRWAHCDPLWNRSYPWTPTQDEKTVPQSFAAIRAGIMPTLQNNGGEIVYVLVDIHTPEGLAAFEDQSTRAIEHGSATFEKISKKRAKARTKLAKGTGLKKKILDAGEAANLMNPGLGMNA